MAKLKYLYPETPGTGDLCPGEPWYKMGLSKSGVLWPQRWPVLIETRGGRGGVTRTRRTNFLLRIRVRYGPTPAVPTGVGHPDPTLGRAF